MSNTADARARREEEIAFLIMEDVLGVDIRLADAGGGNSKPDGEWVIPGSKRRGIIEVTAPDERKLLKKWAQQRRDGQYQEESGSMPTRFNQLTEVCNEILSEAWVLPNFKKLKATPADERHLFLFAHGERYGHYFYRLSDTYADEESEPVGELDLPEEIDCVWFRGRANRESPDECVVRVARFLRGSGWQRHAVTIQELDLPSPTPSIAGKDRWATLRHPKDRSQV